MLNKKTKNFLIIALISVFSQACKTEFVNPEIIPPLIAFDSIGTVNYNSTSNIINVQGFGKVIAFGNTHLYERGFIFDDTNNVPTVDDNDNKIKMASLGLGVFNAPITPLPPARKVYIRTYSLYYKEISYSEVKTVETPKSRPVLKATSIDTNLITINSAKFNGLLVYTGGENVTEQGFVYGTSSNPTTSNSRIEAGNFTEGSPFSGEATGLTSDKTYFVRAFAINSLGTTYSSQLTFKTKKP